MRAALGEPFKDLSDAEVVRSIGTHLHRADGAGDAGLADGVGERGPRLMRAPGAEVGQESTHGGRS